MVRALLLIVAMIVAGLVYACVSRSPSDGGTRPSASPTDESELVLVGRVTRVVDGDTIDVQLDSGPIRVRLDSVDAPERRQPWGAQSAEALEKRANGREVELAVTEQDRYDRMVSTIYVDGEDVNAWLITEGHAWAYRTYLNNETFLALEQQARDAGRGLWSLPDAVAPWNWRRGERLPTDEFDDLDDFEAPTPESAAPTLECGTKRYCADMASCEEAHYFLETCGLSRLDGNDDGVPCEAICRQ